MVRGLRKNEVQTILAYELDLGSKFMRLGSVLEASRRHIEASSRRLKHRVGRLKAAKRCRSTPFQVFVARGVVQKRHETLPPPSPPPPGGRFFFPDAIRKTLLRLGTRCSIGREGIILYETKRTR